MEDKIYFEKLMEWFKKEKPEMYDTYKDNIEFKDGKISINENNGVSYLDGEMVLKILDQHPDFD